MKPENSKLTVTVTIIGNAYNVFNTVFLKEMERREALNVDRET